MLFSEKELIDINYQRLKKIMSYIENCIWQLTL